MIYVLYAVAACAPARRTFSVKFAVKFRGGCVRACAHEQALSSIQGIRGGCVRACERRGSAQSADPSGARRLRW